MREAASAAGVRGDALGNPAALAQGRRRLYQPGGPIAKMLSVNPTLLKINDTLFAHGGVLPQHCEPLAPTAREQEAHSVMLRVSVLQLVLEHCLLLALHALHAC